MSRRSVSLAVRLSAVLAAALPLGGSLAGAPSEDEVKVAFILNFIKYTTWPASSGDDATLRICADHAQALGGRLDALGGRQVSGRTIRVLAPVRPADWRGCQVLYLSRPDAATLADGLRAVAPAPVLTVSDMPDFVDAGGMIGLKLRADRVRFDINQGAARRGGLVLSSQLLKLADEVKP